MPNTSSEDAVEIAAIQAEFAGWHICRALDGDGEPSSWMATRLVETTGADPIIMTSTVEQLREALADQRDLAERLGLRPVVEVSPGSDAS